ncbi:MAG: hypothetical protein AB1846_15280, partial [Chloroflexota bacterium]
INRYRLAAMRLPRLVITPHPMGRTLGAPGDHATQGRVLRAALDLLEQAKGPREIVDLPGNYRPDVLKSTIDAILAGE